MESLLGLIALGAGILLFVGANLLAFALMIEGTEDKAAHEPRH
jgi:hypothetical protein